jgi:hypothetical protein
LDGFAELFAQDPLDPGDRLADHLLGADVLGDNAMDRLRLDVFRFHLDLPPVARDRNVVVRGWA